MAANMMLKIAVPQTEYGTASLYSVGSFILFIIGNVKKLIQNKNATVPNDSPKAASTEDGNIGCWKTCLMANTRPPPGESRMPEVKVTRIPPRTATTPKADVNANTA